MRTVRLTLDDILAAGSVEQAIEAWAAESGDTASGVVGPAYSTSGPGPGWSKTHGPDDFALRAMEEGFPHYIDSSDGRVKSCIPSNEEDGDFTIEGVSYNMTMWTPASVVRLECPSVEEAVESPGIVAHMAQAVIDSHGPLSDRRAWIELVRSIRAAGEALEDIDPDDL